MVVSVAGVEILQRECVFTRVLAAGVQVHCQSENLTRFLLLAVCHLF